jgi:hypothetical protein
MGNNGIWKCRMFRSSRWCNTDFSKISDTSDIYIKTYNDRFIDGLSGLATMYTSSNGSDYVDCDVIFIKVISKDLQPVIEYATYISRYCVL